MKLFQKAGYSLVPCIVATVLYDHCNENIFSGHDYVSNEDLDNATLSFRDAIRIDARHYNTWYRLGNIFCRRSMPIRSHELEEEEEQQMVAG